MQIVNGYVCQDPSDVALAKRGVNPARPHGEADPAGQTNPTSDATSGRPTQPAVTFSGALAQVDGVSSAGSSTGQQPTQPFAPGSQVDVMI